MSTAKSKFNQRPIVRKPIKKIRPKFNEFTPDVTDNKRVYDVKKMETMMYHSNKVLYDPNDKSMREAESFHRYEKI